MAAIKKMNRKRVWPMPLNPKNMVRHRHFEFQGKAILANDLSWYRPRVYLPSFYGCRHPLGHGEPPKVRACCYSSSSTMAAAAINQSNNLSS